MSDKKEMKDWFHYGRGSVSDKLAKTNTEVIAQESAESVDGMEPTGDGKEVLDYGAKPLYATGEKPFHEGRGLGRGHGPEEK